MKSAQGLEMILRWHKRRRVHRLPAMLLFGATCLGAVTPNAIAQNIWYAPSDNKNLGGKIRNPDFPQLFENPSKWEASLSHLSLLELDTAYLMRARDSELKKILEFLHQRDVEIGVGMSLLPVEGCGGGVEGLTRLEQVREYGRVLRQREIPISYIIMDEPLFYGHDYTGPHACELSLREVAQRLSKSAAILREFYPRVKFVLIEPPQTLSGGVSELKEFLIEYRKAMAENPALVIFDVGWDRDWRSGMLAFTRWANGSNMPFGVIYNGTYRDRTDTAWISSAKTNIELLELKLGIVPSVVLFASWDPNPTKSIPDTEPDTETGLIRWYVDQKHGNQKSLQTR